MGSPAIFSGSFVKLLKSQLNLNNNTYILTGSADPTSLAQNAPIGSIYLRNGGSTTGGKMYVKQDSGSSTNWREVAAGAMINPLLDSLKNQLAVSQYNYLTPNVFATDASTKVDVSSTGAFSPVSNDFNFGAIGQTLVSSNMLDSDFIAQGLDVGQVDLAVTWDSTAVDTGATYQVSRDGGTNYQTLAMTRVGTSPTYSGTLAFAVEGSYSTLASVAGSTTGVQQLSSASIPDVTTGIISTMIANDVTFTSTTLVTGLSLAAIGKSGSPAGNVFVSLVKDNGSGQPSTNPADTVVTSASVAISTITNGGAFAPTITPTLVAPGTYHVVFQTDAAYKASFVNSGGGATYISIPQVTGNDTEAFNGTSWVNATTARQLKYVVTGRSLDLRVKITSSILNTKLAGYGVFYGLYAGTLLTGIKNQASFSFNSTVDNTSTFTLPFLPDTSTLKCYYKETGQVFLYGAFTTQGYNVVFPANTFNNAGVSSVVTLFFDQTIGGGFDNSDVNSALMADNHLGSSGSYSKAVAGRGIVLMRPDGTLREIALDNNDNIVIKSYP